MVDVEKSCDDILAYIELRIVPSKGARRPRFSLYLSALLMYGVVRIHQKHIDYLLGDVSNAFLRATSLATLKVHDIDLPEIPKADQVTNPEILEQELCRAEDLYLSQLDTELLRAESAELGEFWNLSGPTPILSNGSPTPKKRKRRQTQDESVPLVADIEQITMRDPPPLIVDTPLSPIQVPKDVDLPMLDNREMELLLGQVEEPALQVSDLLPTSTPFNLDVDSDTRQALRFQQTALESPSRIIQEDKEKTPERPPLSTVPETRAVPPSPGVTQQIITSPLPRRNIPGRSLELELTADVPSPTQRKRKRQLAFADAETQIPKNKMKQHMTTGKDTCENFVLPDVHGVGATDLLAVAGKKELRKEPWHHLWARNARFRRNIPEQDLAEAISPPPLQAPDQLDLPTELPAVDMSTLQNLGETLTLGQPAALSSVVPPPSEDRRRSKRNISTLEESVEELRRISMSMTGTPAPDISLREINRDASTSRIETPQPLGLDDSLILEESRDSRKGSTKKRRTRSTASKDDEQQAPPSMMELPSGTSLQTSHTSTGRTLYDVVEEPRFEGHFVAVPLLQYMTEDQEQLQEELLKSIEGDIEDQADQYTTFLSICPPQLVDRKTAARKFSALLELCAKGSVIVTQQHCYEDIYIRMTE